MWKGRNLTLLLMTMYHDGVTNPRTAQSLSWVSVVPRAELWSRHRHSGAETETASRGSFRDEECVPWSRWVQCEGEG